MEETIMNQLVDKTRVIVTHEIQYVSSADRVIIMDCGKVIADGTYDEIKNNEIYQELKKSMKSTASSDGNNIKIRKTSHMESN